VHTLRVEITVVSVVITFVSVKIRMHVKITLWLYKSHSWVSYLKLLSCEWKSHFACKITLCVLSFVLFVITVRVEITPVSVLFSRIRVKLTIRAEITLVSVKITLWGLKSHSACKITLWRLKSLLCVLKSHLCVL
jgi:hypothetical protein